MARLTINVACAAAMLGGSVRADLITHCRVTYGNTSLVTVEQFGTVHAAASNSYTTPGSFSGSADAWSGYGLVRGTAGASALNASFEVQLSQAEAAFSDTLTITGAAGPGFVVYEYTVTGSTIGSGHQAHAHLFLRHGSDPDEELGDDLTSTAVLTSLPHSFVFGAPFTTGVLLSAEVHMHHGHTGTALADFSAGAMLTAVQVFDWQMNPVASFVIGSESGTQYPLPAPSVATLTASGLTFFLRRNRRS